MNNILSGGINELEQIKSALITLNQVRDNIEGLNADKLRLEKEIDSDETLLLNTIDETISKRRQEVVSSFDKEIEKDQTRLKKVRSDRDKKKAKKVNERIIEETKELNEENRTLRDEIRNILKQKGISKVFDNKLVYSLYFPKGIIEKAILLLFFVLDFFAIPYLITKLLLDWHWFFESIVYILIVAILTYLYYYGFSYFRTENKETYALVSLPRQKIIQNKKTIKIIIKEIKKDKNEENYDLSTFDTQINEIEGSIKNVVDQKNVALQLFEKETKEKIAQEIKAQNEPRIEELKKNLFEVVNKSRELQEKQKEILIYNTSNYEAFIGKENMDVERIERLQIILQEQNASNISEAIQKLNNTVN